MDINDYVLIPREEYAALQRRAAALDFIIVTEKQGGFDFTVRHAVKVASELMVDRLEVREPARNCPAGCKGDPSRYADDETELEEHPEDAKC